MSYFVLLLGFGISPSVLLVARLASLRHLEIRLGNLAVRCLPSHRRLSVQSPTHKAEKEAGDAEGARMLVPDEAVDQDRETLVHDANDGVGRRAHLVPAPPSSVPNGRPDEAAHDEPEYSHGTSEDGHDAVLGPMAGESGVLALASHSGEKEHRGPSEKVGVLNGPRHRFKIYILKDLLPVRHLERGDEKVENGPDISVKSLVAELIVGGGVAAGSRGNEGQRGPAPRGWQLPAKESGVEKGDNERSECPSHDNGFHVRKREGFHVAEDPHSEGYGIE